MATTKAPHHRGPHQTLAARVVAAANADPTTRCGKCGRTLNQHPPTRTGNPPKWSAGHIIDGQIGGPYQPEVLSCNSRAGGLIGNRSPKRRKGAAWRPTPPPVRNSELTW